jgi:hypothetical protein
LVGADDFAATAGFGEVFFAVLAAAFDAGLVLAFVTIKLSSRSAASRCLVALPCAHTPNLREQPRPHRQKGRLEPP